MVVGVWPVWDAIPKAGPVAVGSLRAVSAAQRLWESRILLGSSRACVTGASNTWPGLVEVSSAAL